MTPNCNNFFLSFFLCSFGWEKTTEKKAATKEEKKKE